MSDMKLIMENWSKYRLSEAPEELETVGQLKRLIRIHRAKEAGKEAGKKAAEVAIGQIPVVSNIFSAWQGIKDAKEMVGKLYGAEDKFQTNTALDKLNIDDNVSKIVDDPVEVAYLNDLLNRMASEQDSDRKVVDFLGGSIEKDLQKFLAANFDSFTIKK